MAIYRFNATIISKGAGASAVASAAYRHATTMMSARSGVLRDYSYKAGELAHEEITVPDSPVLSQKPQSGSEDSATDPD